MATREKAGVEEEAVGSNRHVSLNAILEPSSFEPPTSHTEPYAAVAEWYIRLIGSDAQLLGSSVHVTLGRLGAEPVLAGERFVRSHAESAFVAMGNEGPASPPKTADPVQPRPCVERSGIVGRERC